jgi:hypothetical protein
MNPEEKLNKIKEQNRQRAKKYYLKNKVTILEKIKLNKKPYIPTKTTTEPSARTISFYKETEKTLNKILDIKPDYKKHNQIIKKINNAKHNDKLYSINTKKNFYQLILKMIYDEKIKVNLKSYNAYKYQFELLNIISRDKTATAQDAETVLTFDDYLPLIKNEYGEKSKQYLIAKLYSFNGFRDDLNLVILTNKNNEPDETKNYVIIPQEEGQGCLIILNEYKTSKRYGQDIMKVPADISNLIKEYKKNNDLKEGELLFNTKSLSKYIKNFNIRIGLNITINKLRQMKVSEQLNKTKTPEERLDLSHKMKHSPETSKKYKRNNITSIVV